MLVLDVTANEDEAGTMSSMNAKEIELLRKLVAQMDSGDSDGEVARNKARDLLARHGKRMSDIPEVLGSGGAQASSRAASDSMSQDVWQRLYYDAIATMAARSAASEQTI